MATVNVRPVLSVILQPQGDVYIAECPDLDIITEHNTPRLALNDLTEAIQEYAEDYKTYFDLYSKSTDRVLHWPLLQQVLACKNKREVKALLGL